MRRCRRITATLAVIGAVLATAPGAHAGVFHTTARAEVLILHDSPRLETIQCYGVGHNRGRDRYRRFECLAVRRDTWYTFGVYFASLGIWYRPHDQGKVG